MTARTERHLRESPTHVAGEGRKGMAEVAQP
jgi:hypothetical protein